MDDQFVRLDETSVPAKLAETSGCAPYERSRIRCRLFSSRPRRCHAGRGGKRHRHAMNDRLVIEQLVIRSLAAVMECEPSRIRLATSTAELGVDSFAMFWLISQVEEALETELSPAQVMQIFQSQSVGDLVDAISRSKRLR